MQTTAFNVNREIFDIYSGDLKAFGGRYEFAPWDSLMVIGNKTHQPFFRNLHISDRKGINVVRVEINGTEKTMMTSDCLSLKDCGVKGKTKIRLTLVNNLCNMLGPHHLKEASPKIIL